MAKNNYESMFKKTHLLSNFPQQLPSPYINEQNRTDFITRKLYSFLWYNIFMQIKFNFHGA